MPNTPNYDLEKPDQGDLNWDVPLNSNFDKIDAHTHAGGTHNQVHAINSADHTGTLDDAQIPATIARDTEVTTAVTNHEAAANPHPTYETSAEAQAKVDTHVNDTGDAHDASAISFTPNGSIAATDVQAAIQEVRDEAAGGGAPSTADYLVGTAQGGLSAEIVVGTSPGGELGGTWASPTVDATHAGSTHSAATDTHIADTSAAHAASAISIADAGGDFTATDVEGALDELQADNEAHVAAADPHTGYVLESVVDAVGDLIVGSAADAVGRLAKGSDGQVLQTDSAETLDLKWVNLFIPVEFSKAGTLTTGTGAHRWYNDSGRTLTFHSTRASVGTQPTGASILIDVNKNGTTIFTTQSSRPTIAVSTNTDQGAAPDVTTIADGDYITVDIDQIGSGVAGADLVVQIWLRG